MPFNELRGFAREIFLEKKIEELVSIYRASKKRLLRQMSLMDLTDYQKARTEYLLAQINAEIVSLNQVVRDWAKKAGTHAYYAGLDISQDRIRALNVSRYVNYGAVIHKSAINVLVDSMTIDFLTANQSIKRNITNIIKMTQQKLIEDKQISKMLAEGMIEGQTRRQISGRLAEEFKKRIDDERLITVNGKNYLPESYSRMVTRSRFMEASNTASVNSALQYGLDLVQVSVHSGSCDVCDPFQGKIFSISGTNPDFPVLEDRPPYHPNCRHVLLPVTKEYLMAKGLYRNSSRFSFSSKSVDTFKDFESELKYV